MCNEPQFIHCHSVYCLAMSPVDQKQSMEGALNTWHSNGDGETLVDSPARGILPESLWASSLFTTNRWKWYAQQTNPSRAVRPIIKMRKEKRGTFSRFSYSCPCGWEDLMDSRPWVNKAPAAPSFPRNRRWASIAWLVVDFQESQWRHVTSRRLRLPPLSLCCLQYARQARMVPASVCLLWLPCSLSSVVRCFGKWSLARIPWRDERRCQSPYLWNQQNYVTCELPGQEA